MQLVSNRLQSCCRFLESFGYPLYSQFFYKEDDWWSLYEVNRKEFFDRKSQTYQILISSIDYEKSHDLSDRRLYQSASRRISYTISDLLSLLALQHFYEILENMILDLKNELDPYLNSQIEGKINLRNLKLATSKMLILNGVSFQNSRIWTGVDKDLFFNYIRVSARKMSL